MAKTKSADAACGGEPRQYRSRAGYAFREDEDPWVLDKNTKIRPLTIAKHLDREVAKGFIRTLAFFGENYAPASTSLVADTFRRFLTSVRASSITPENLISFRSTLSERTEWHLGTLRPFLRTWHTLGYPGVSDEVVQLLGSWTLKGPIKGDVVKRLDPLKGPLTDIELNGFNEGAVQAFERSLISLSDLALALCLSQSGRRPIQISQLRLKDVLEGTNRNGDATYLLNVPRAKQRGQLFRAQFKQFAMTYELWVLLKEQARLVVAHARDALPFSLKPSEELELPLFPDFSAFKGVASRRDFANVMESDAFHCRSRDIAATLKRIGKAIDLYSERTGEPLALTPSRFRYTVGTRAAREGLGPLIIAELLDHTDTQHAGVYIENIPDHVAALDKAVGLQLAPYAQAFSGVLVDNERGARRGDDPASRIRTNAGGIGTCGSYGFCGANVPIPCYTCIHFQPWLEGPHELVLDELLAERKRVAELTDDPSVSAATDRTILAVSEVIQRCEHRKQELNRG